MATAVILALGWFVGVLPGCSKPYETHRVTGVVFLDRTPVEDAEVVFLPLSALEAKPARGKTDVHGQFNLHTYFGPGNDVAGAMAGEYVVTIRKLRGANDPDRLQRPEDMIAPKNELPSRYADRKTAGLSAIVTARAENKFEFLLRSGPSRSPH